MHLIYVDESGNTGPKLNDRDQPVHFLAAVFVPEEVWLGGRMYWRTQVMGLARELAEDAGLPCPQELHAKDVRGGQGHFQGIPRPDRERIIRAVLSMLHDYRLDVIYASCHKPRLASQDWGGQAETRWLIERLLYPGQIGPPEEPLEPELPGALAWSLLLSGCNAHLAATAGGPAHGLIIADQSKLQAFARRSVRATELISLADHPGPPSEDEIIEEPVFLNLLDTVHFVDSRESPYIQLVDFVVHFIMLAWRAGNWERPGSEPHYDELIRPAVQRAYHYPRRET